MASALALNRRFRWALYVAFALLFATGAAWLIADQLKDSPSGEFWQATTANLLMVHGGAAMVTLLLLGALFPTHIARAWRGRLNRVSGAIMAATNITLIVTAFGLYYLGSDTFRPWISDAHIAAGLALPALLIFHVWFGRRQIRNRSVRKSS
jgi:hypothetical protein